ncbi:MAG: TIGR04086 family membrane protein [Oscillospiraceae bacterium]|jgi:putative membrane protein (TIGR04086 family)|nr:TIGR04086 family membrane protein [Oscillospiraceae bacterium]
MEHATAKSTNKAERKAFKLPLKALMIGGGLGAVLFFILLAVLAFFLPGIGIKASWLPYISVLIAGLSAFISSYISAKGRGEKGLLLGIGCALIEAALLGTVLMIVANGFGAVTAFLYIALLGCGGAGGVFGVNSAARQ